MNNKLEALIVDDESPARQELIFLLKQNYNNNIKIIGEATNGIDAVEKINKLDPQVIFLDIKMPGLNGLQVAQIVLEKKPNIKIVFVTAFDEYAIKAFEINAIDYLVKPINLERLKKTIKRLLNKSFPNNSEDNIEKLVSEIKNLLPNQNLETLPCEENGKIVLIKKDEIFYCTVENGTSYVGTNSKKIKTLYTLKELEQKLHFFRSHRSFLVNLNYVKHLHPMFHGSYSLTLDDNKNTEVPVSRNNSKKLRELLQL